MLETEIRQVFSRQATEQPPPARISLPAARAAARKRRAWRRAGVLGAPLLAAAAVMSIAVASVIPGGGIGLGQGPVASPVAPKYFNPLRPYASIGWLPRGFGALDDTTSRVSLTITSLGRTTSVSFTATSSGRCHVSGHYLSCVTAPGVTSVLFQLGRQAGVVDGHAAHLLATRPGPALSPVPSSSPSTLKSPKTLISPQPNGSSQPSERSPQIAAAPLESGTLIWQYARGGWATLFVTADRGSFLQTALRIARSIRFGPAVAPPIRFRYQLTHVPADWYVAGVQVAWQHAVPFAQFYRISAGRYDSPWLFPLPPSVVAILSAGNTVPCGHALGSRTATINGYEVILSPGRLWAVPQLCASNADGVGLAISVEHSPISAASLFAHHLRLLGPDPHKWTTEPIAASGH